MTQVEERLAALLDRKSREAREPSFLPPHVARAASRARFTRRVAAPVVVVAGLGAVVALTAGTFTKGEPVDVAAIDTVPSPHFTGTSGSREWRVTAYGEDGEHCLLVEVTVEGRHVDNSHNCVVHVGLGEADSGPSLTTVDAGGESLGLLGTVGPRVKTVSLETEDGRTTVEAMPLAWESPPESSFYIIFVDGAEAGTVSTFDGEGRLLKETRVEFVDGNVHARE